MSHHVRVFLIIPALVLPFTALTQTPSDTTIAPPTVTLAGRVTSGMQLRVGGTLFDNFFQRPSGLPHQDVRAASADLRLVQALGAAQRSSIRARAGITAFDKGLSTAGVAELGARAAAGRQMLDVALSAHLNSPRFEVGEALERADAMQATVDYSFLIGSALQLAFLADASRERYERVEQNDNTVYDVGGSLRWRGFGSEFSPEIGALIGRRNVDNERESFDQRTLYVQLRVAPSRNLYASARWRRRLREYDTPDVTATNYRRDDTRHQLTAGISLTPRAGPAWDVYYALEDVDSSRDERSFRAHSLSLGVTFRMAQW